MINEYYNLNIRYYACLCDIERPVREYRWRMRRKLLIQNLRYYYECEPIKFGLMQNQNIHILYHDGVYFSINCRIIILILGD